MLVILTTTGDNLHFLMTNVPAKPLRVDAQRNHDKILAAASDLFAEVGTDVPMEAVAA